MTIRLADYQKKLAKGYNIGVKSRVFMPGDLVYERPWGA